MPTLDASTPARVLSTSSGGGITETFVTASFSPPANSWLYCSRTSNELNATTATFNTPSNTGTALSWSLVASKSNASGGGCAVFRAFNTNAQAGITVTATITYSSTNGRPDGSRDVSMWVDVWTGADSSQTGAAATSSTSTTQTNNPSLNTTRDGSRVAMVGLDWSAGGNPTSSDTNDPYTVASQTSGARIYKAADSGAAGSYSCNYVTAGASPINSIVIYEILAAAQNISPVINRISPALSGPRAIAWLSRPQVPAVIPVAAAAAGANADLNVTEGSDTVVSATGIGIAGTLAVTELSDTVVSSTGIGVGATLVVTEGADTIVSAAGVGIGLGLNVTEAGDTILSNVVTGIGLGFNVTEAGDTIVSGATVSLSASLNVTETSDSVLSNTGIGIAATLNVTELSDSVLSSATVTNSGVNAGLSVTEDSDSILSGASIALSGSVSITEDDDSISAFLDTGNPIVVTAAGPIAGAGRGGRKLRILPDGTRLYATEDEVRKILTHFYKPKSLDDVKLLPKKVQQKFREQPVEIDLVQFDKHVPKFYELKTEKRLVQGDYSLFLKALRRKEEEEFLYLVMEML